MTQVKYTDSRTPIEKAEAVFERYASQTRNGVLQSAQWTVTIMTAPTARAWAHQKFGTKRTGSRKALYNELRDLLGE